MSWTYEVSTGKMTTPQGFTLGECYSGNGAGLNNSAMEAVHDVGPIPRGQYQIGDFFEDPQKGPIVAHLTPVPPFDALGRSGFMIHGDNQLLNHSASEGCIVAARFIREQISESEDTILEVV